MTSLVLATAVAADKKYPYLKSSDGEFYLGSYDTSDDGDQGLLAFYPKIVKRQAIDFRVNNDTTLTLGPSYPGIGLNFFLDNYVPGPDGLYAEIWAYEQVRDSIGATGFAWSKNGTLEFHNDDFHGWYHCQGGNYTTQDGSTAFYWASKPIGELDDGCKKIELVQYWN